MSASLSLDFKQFFELSDPFATRPLRLIVIEHNEWISSDLAGSLFKGHYSLKQPLKLGIHSGGQLTDFLWSAFPPITCISERAIKILQENEITGWSTYPVEVYDRKGKAIPNYHGFAVTSGECRRDRSRSPIVTKQAVPGGEPFQVYKGLYFHEEDWDGSDIFLVKPSGGIVVTEKVYKILKRTKNTNVKLKPLLEVERDVYLDKFDHGS